MSNENTYTKGHIKAKNKFDTLFHSLDLKNIHLQILGLLIT